MKIIAVNGSPRKNWNTDIGADAQMVLAGGVIVTNAIYNNPAAVELFGTQSFREDDYTFCYKNLKSDAAKHIDACKTKGGDRPACSRNAK